MSGLDQSAEWLEADDLGGFASGTVSGIRTRRYHARLLAEASAAARPRFLAPLFKHLPEAGLGHISEIAAADSPHPPRGCPCQAWSLGELLRLDRSVLAP